MFSFYEEGLEKGRYELDEDDKDLVVDILRVSFNSEDTELPYGIRIGYNTKSEIKELYPEDTYYSWINKDTGIDMIGYDYNFPDENGELQIDWAGVIAYYFDENEVLAQVSIQWYYFDL